MMTNRVAPAVARTVPVRVSVRPRGPQRIPPVAAPPPAVYADPSLQPQHARLLGRLSNGLSSGIVDPVLHAVGFKSYSLHSTTGGRLHVMDCCGTGNLPPIVVLPGLGARISDYALLLLRLRHHFQRVMAIDLPGLGQSSAVGSANFVAFHQTIQNVLDQISNVPFVLLGHSLGADAALEYATRRPDRLAGVIAYSPPSGPYTPAYRQQVKNLFAVATRQDALTVGTKVFGARSRLLTAVLRSRLSTPAAQGLIQHDIMDYCPSREKLARLPPCLFVHAEHEGLLPPLAARYYIDNLPPTAECAVGLGLTHSSVASGPPRQVDLMQDFVRRRVCQSGQQ